MNYIYNEALFEYDSSVKYYIIGLILADGYISKYNNRIELALQERDKEFLDNIKNIICPGKKLKYKQNTKAYKLTIDNKFIYNEVCKYVNDLPKSKTLIFPYGIPDEYILDFIRGYSDGDGNISVKRGQRKFDDEIRYYYGIRYRVLGTKQFLVALAFNLKRLGVAKNLVNTHKKGKESVYYIEYGFNQAINVLNALYDNAEIFLKRKYDTYQNILNMDSDQIAKNYGKIEGRYNMQV